MNGNRRGKAVARDLIQALSVGETARSLPASQLVPISQRTAQMWLWVGGRRDVVPVVRALSNDLS